MRASPNLPKLYNPTPPNVGVRPSGFFSSTIRYDTMIHRAPATVENFDSKSFPSSVTCASASFHWLGGRQVGCRRGFLQYFSKPLLISIGQNWKTGSITFKYYISKILVKWVLLQMWKCVPDTECGFPSSSYMDDRQARFRARVRADRFASTLPYMWFLTRLWKVLLIECVNLKYNFYTWFAEPGLVTRQDWVGGEGWWSVCDCITAFSQSALRTL